MEGIKGIEILFFIDFWGLLLCLLEIKGKDIKLILVFFFFYWSFFIFVFNVVLFIAFRFGYCNKFIGLLLYIRVLDLNLE